MKLHVTFFGVVRAGFPGHSFEGAPYDRSLPGFMNARAWHDKTWAHVQ